MFVMESEVVDRAGERWRSWKVRSNMCSGNEVIGEKFQGHVWR